MIVPHPLDDGRIADDDELLRRLTPLQYDSQDNLPIPDAFNPRKKEKKYINAISLALRRLTTFRDAMSSEMYRADIREWKLAMFEARVPRGLGLYVRLSPTKNNPAHAQVGDAQMLSDMRVRRKLAEASQLVNWYDEEE